jgi:hypothetical protein
MKLFGYLVITAGFLGGSFYSVRAEEGVPLVPYLAALGVGIAGVALARFALRREARHEDTLSANIATLEASLGQVVALARTLEAERDSIDVFDLRHRIDQQFLEPLDAFVQARESLIHTFGLQPYADVMNPFAAGERNLNRVWSASTDGYIDEAHTYITLAREQFEDALEVFRRLQGPKIGSVSEPQ